MATKGGLEDKKGIVDIDVKREFHDLYFWLGRHDRANRRKRMKCTACVRVAVTLASPTVAAAMAILGFVKTQDEALDIISEDAIRIKMKQQFRYGGWKGSHG